MKSPLFPLRRMLLSSKTRLSAFTLIELLVVIGIIAILAALAFPVFNRVNRSADGAKCMANLRQIGIAMIAYAGENDGCFPISGDVCAYGIPDTTTQRVGWTEQLEKYLPTNSGTDTKIFICPSSSKLYPNNVKYSYFNGCRGAYDQAVELKDPENPKNYAPVRQVLLKFPAKYILGGDIASNAFGPNDTDKDDYTQDPAFTGNVSALHNGKSNILFADGHIGAFESFEHSQMTVGYDKMIDYYKNVWVPGH